VGQRIRSVCCFVSTQAHSEAQPLRVCCTNFKFEKYYEVWAGLVVAVSVFFPRSYSQYFIYSTYSTPWVAPHRAGALTG